MTVLFILITLQGFMGAFDTLYHHELKAKLPYTPAASLELIIHGMRNVFYVIIFFSLAWLEWHGCYAYLFFAMLVIEVALTLWDFVVEDHTRELPSTERITHTLLTLNYGAILMLLVPIVLHWSNSTEESFRGVNHGLFSWVLTFFALGVLAWAVRDTFSGIRLRHQRPDHSNQAGVLAESKRFLVTGGTGFIGSRLCADLIRHGHDVTILTRNFVHAGKKLSGKVQLIDSFEQISDDEIFDVVVNLAGQSLGARRWNKSYKALLISSRVDMTNALAGLIGRLKTKPDVLINGSAIGFYGNSGDKVLDESAAFVDGFSHQLCQQWEDAAKPIAQMGVRVCCLRIGLVLGAQGGPLQDMLPAFRFGGGGPFGDGKQWMSWIHVDDLIGIVLHIIRNDKVDGVVNGVAPSPETNAQFAKVLGAVLHRPAAISLPAWIIPILLGEMGKELLLSGQRVLPQKVLDSGYQFQYPELRGALAEILER